MAGASAGMAGGRTVDVQRLSAASGCGFTRCSPRNEPDKFVSGCSRPWPYLTLPPFGCTSVATPGNRSPARPARRMGDLWRQVSWLTARTSLSSLPGAPTRSASGVIGEDLPLTVAGAATVLTLVASHRVPSSSRRACARLDTVTPLDGRRNGTLSTQIRTCAGERRTC